LVPISTAAGSASAGLAGAAVDAQIEQGQPGGGGGVVVVVAAVVNDHEVAVIVLPARSLAPLTVAV